MRGWVEESLLYYAWWLQYFKACNGYLDYCNPTLQVWVDHITIDDVFDAPITQRDWKVSNKDIIRIRYSFLQKVKRELEPSACFHTTPY